MKIGDKVRTTKMPESSHYLWVEGTITRIENGWADIRATFVQDKWSDTPHQHSTSCATSAKIGDLVLA